LMFFKKIKIDKNLKVFEKINSSIYALSLIVFSLGAVFVSIGDGLDIYISGLFYKGGENFILQGFDFLSILIRSFFLKILVIYLVILPPLSMLLPIKIIFFNFKFKFKEIIFIFFTISFNLVLMVNILLKDMWGRARPNDILELGGENVFTPWYNFSQECFKNCSFVSGDAAVGFSIIIFYFITKKKIFFWLALFLGGILSITRILEGGHFFSDVWFAGFFIFTLSFIEFWAYNKISLKNDL
jgi:lipid A 4'-phosphatase